MVEHRSKVEITADEVGPSLRYATADVQRVERRGTADSDAGAPGEPADALSVEA